MGTGDGERRSISAHLCPLAGPQARNSVSEFLKENKPNRGSPSPVHHSEATPSVADYYTVSRPFDATCARLLWEHCRKSPDIPIAPGDVRDMLRAVTELIKPEPRCPNFDVPVTDSLVVVGDIHGQLADLLLIFQKYGPPNPAASHYIFNGDFVDRGVKTSALQHVKTRHAWRTPGQVAV